MKSKKLLSRLIATSVAAGTLAFAPTIDLDYGVINIKAANVAHAEVKEYVGVGDYVFSDEMNIGQIKEKAKLYAQRNALEQAGIFVTSLTEVKNGIVTKDEIMTIAGNILKIIDTEYTLITINDKSGIAKYRATVKAQIDTNTLTDAINKFTERNAQERSQLVEQTKSQQRIIEEQAKRIAELEKLIANTKNAQDNEKIDAEIKSIDKETLYAQKLEEANKLRNQGNHKEAIKIYDEAIQLNPNKAAAYSGRSRSYFSNGNYMNALEDITKAIEFEPNEETYYNLRGSIYHILGFLGSSENYHKAIADYRRAIQLKPDDINYKNLADSYGLIGDSKNQLESLNKAISINPEATTYDDYCELAVANYREKNHQQAIKAYNKAIEMEPNKTAAYEGRANIYVALKDYNNAIKDFTKLIEIDPNDSGLTKNITTTVYVFKDNISVYEQRAYCYTMIGDNKKAEADLDKARELGYKA